MVRRRCQRVCVAQPHQLVDEHVAVVPASRHEDGFDATVAVAVACAATGLIHISASLIPWTMQLLVPEL